MPHWHRYDRHQRYKLSKNAITGYLILVLLEGLTTITISSFVASHQIQCRYTQAYNAASYLGICFGLVIVVISAHGLSLINQPVNYPIYMLLTIEGFSVITFGIVVTTVAHVYRKRVTNHDLFEELTDYMQGFSADDGSRTCWNSMQDELKCCGLQHFSDWANNSLEYSSSFQAGYLNDSAADPAPLHLPNSCQCSGIPRPEIVLRCKRSMINAGVYYFISPCYPLYEDLLLSNLNILRIYFPCLLVFQVLQFSVIFYFALKINNLNAVQQIYTVS